MTMHAGHSSPNGLGLADSLAQHNKQWPPSLETQEEPVAAAAAAADLVDQSEVDTPIGSPGSSADQSATQTQDDPTDLYKQLFELSNRPGAESARVARVASIFESDDSDSPVEVDSPVASPAPIIQETPHDEEAPQELTVWARTMGVWRPAYRLESSADQVIVKFPGQENATTLKTHETKELVLEIGTRVRAGHFDGEFPITDLIQDPQHAFCTPGKFSSVEIIVGRSAELVPVETLYIQDTMRAPKRTKMAAMVFEGALFAAVGVPELEEIITTHGGSLVDPASLVDLEGNWRPAGVAGAQSAQFAAVLVPGIPTLAAPLALQGIAMGWPCLDPTFIKDSIHKDKLLDPLDYALAPCHQYPGLSLEHQFYCRTVALGAILPRLYWLGDQSSPMCTLLATAAAKHVEVIKDLSSAIPGSLVVTTDGDDLHAATQAQLSRKSSLCETVCVSSRWLVERVQATITSA